MVIQWAYFTCSVGAQHVLILVRELKRSILEEYSDAVLSGYVGVM